MQALKRLTFLAAALALALSGLSLGAVSASDEQPTTSDVLQDEGRAWLGVSIIDGDEGVTVMEVTPDSPADEAGLREGDVITAVDGEPIESAQALVDLIATYAPGDEITVTAEFRGRSTDYTVTLGERPADLDVRPPSVEVRPVPGFSVSGTFNLFGLTAELTDEGLVIESIEDDSPFADAGLQEGDVITQINGKDVTTDLGGLMGAFRLDESLTLTIEREGEEITVEVDLSDLLPDIELPDIELREIRPGRGLGFGTMIGRMLGLDAEMTDEGLQINEITEDSPLADSGLMDGDVIIAVNGISLTDFQPGAMAELLADLMPGGTLTLDVLRDGEETTVEIDIPEAFQFNFAPGFSFRGGQGPMMGFTMGQPTQLGVQFAILTPELAEERGLDVEEGALIERVYEDTPAAEAGLQEGDIITAVDGDPVDQRRTLSERLAAYDEGEVVTLTVIRDGEELSLDVTLGPRNSGNFGMFRRGPNGEGGMFFFGPGMMDEFFESHPFFERGGRFGEGRGPRRGDANPAPEADVAPSAENSAAA